MKWSIACYIRLSREDGDCFESDSITNQRKLLKSYVEKNFELSEYRFYVDENVTGTKFDREHFNRLLNDIENRIINCIIVKDLSRFGRNYIDAGMLLEDFFPKHSVRFISILDGLDTFKDADETTGLMVRIKNLMHDNNSREISRKVRASHALMRKQGLHITHAIYGYKKNPSNKYKLVVDTQVSHVVQWIFSWYASGMGVIRIAQKLNGMGISSCSEYRQTKSLYSLNKTSVWSPNTLRQMLCNYTYIGCVHQGMRTTRSYKDRRIIHLEKDQHIIIENMHDAIIEKKLFFDVQRILESKLKTRTASCREYVYLFSGLLRCSNCGSSMLRCPTFANGKEYIYYKCRRNKQCNKGCIHKSSIRHEIVYSITLKAVKDHIRFLVDMRSRIENQRIQIELKTIKTLKKQLAKVEDDINQQNKLKCTAYEDWKLDFISMDDYKAIKSEIDIRIQEMKKIVKEISNQIDFYSGILLNSDAHWLNTIDQYFNINELNREVVLALIKTIKIGQDQCVDVEFHHRSDIEKISDFLYINKDNNESS